MLTQLESRFTLACFTILSLVPSVLVAENKPGPSKDNVLFIVSDDLRANALSCYGDQLTNTPHLDELAKRGCVFDQAFCQATWCLPSRKSFMRSRYFDDRGPTLGETLREAGIHSARVGKIFHMRVPGDIVDGTDGADVPECWDERFNCQGPETHSEGLYACLNINEFKRSMDGRQGAGTKHRPFVSVMLDDDGQHQPDAKAGRIASGLLEQLSNKQFFLAVGLIRPHYPMVAPKSLFENYPHDEVQLPSTFDISPENSGIPRPGWSGSQSERLGFTKYVENQKRMWSAYRASIEFMDAQIGVVLQQLHDSGLDRTTWIVFTSDHGYLLGDHQFWQKANLHEPVNRVPLIVVPPLGRDSAIKASTRHPFPVELVDIYPTVTEVMGVTNPKSVQGTSLIRKVIESDPNSTAITTRVVKKIRHASIRTNDHAYISYGDGVGELYDMQGDPDQTENLFDDPDHRSLQDRLEGLMRERLANVKE
ncbi:MAG: sulfatase-like hydrolase/transferase [Planctomycetota bacterium]